MAKLGAIIGVASGVVPPVEAHDQALEQLASNVEEYFDALATCPALGHLLNDSVDPGTPLRETFGASPAEEYPSIIAEYIVNNVHHLPSYYSTAAFWNAHQEKFFGVRERPEINTYLADDGRSGKELRDGVG